jgi:hypothetical protein
MEPKMEVAITEMVPTATTSPSSLSLDPATFTLFPKLPFEIRHKIWVQTIEDVGSRIVELGFEW